MKYLDGGGAGDVIQKDMKKIRIQKFRRNIFCVDLKYGRCRIRRNTGINDYIQFIS